VRRFQELGSLAEEGLNQLKNISNPLSRVVDLWCITIIEGFIVEFAVEGSESFSVAKKGFFWGPCGSYIGSRQLWIKILDCNKGIVSL